MKSILTDKVRMTILEAEDCNEDDGITPMCIPRLKYVEENIDLTDLQYDLVESIIDCRYYANDYMGMTRKEHEKWAIEQGIELEHELELVEELDSKTTPQPYRYAKGVK